MNGFTQFNFMSQIVRHFSVVLFLVIFTFFACKKDASVLDVNIERGIKYVENRGGDFEASTGLFFNFLSKKFPLENIPPIKKIYNSPDEFNKHPSTKLYQRLAHPHSISEEDIEQYRGGIPINDLQYIMLAGMYCDEIPLKQDFLQKIKTQTELDGYFLTHAALSIHFAKCLKCPLPNEFESIEKQQIKLLEKLIETTDIQDLKYEAIAILKLMNPSATIKQEWIDEVLDMQLEDGGWARVKKLKTSNDHTTFLALWALLESKYPDAKSVCMVE